MPVLFAFTLTNILVLLLIACAVVYLFGARR